jgi:hypothetical protein
MNIPDQINAQRGGSMAGMVGVPCSGMVGVGSTGIYTFLTDRECNRDKCLRFLR